MAKQTKKKRGPPFKEVTRTRSLRVPMTPAEYELLAEKARGAGLGLAAFARAKLLGT